MQTEEQHQLLFERLAPISDLPSRLEPIAEGRDEDLHDVPARDEVDRILDAADSSHISPQDDISISKSDKLSDIVLSPLDKDPQEFQSSFEEMIEEAAHENREIDFYEKNSPFRVLIETGRRHVALLAPEFQTAGEVRNGREPLEEQLVLLLGLHLEPTKFVILRIFGPNFG